MTLLGGSLLGSRFNQNDVDNAVIQSRIFHQRKKAVIWGDSITNQNVTEDSENLNFTNIGYFNWLNFFSGNSFELLSDAGVSGETTGEILARFSSDVEIYNPEFVFVLAGTNDLIASEDPLNVISNLQKIINSVHGIGAKCVIGTIMPALSLNEAGLYDVNRWIRTCNADYIVDYAGALSDPASSVYPCTLPDVYYDGLHPNLYGAYLMGKEASKVLDVERQRISFWPTNKVDSNNLVLNPFNAGTGGTVSTGVAPDNVTVFGTVPVGSTLTGAVNEVEGMRIFELTATGVTAFSTFTRYDVSIPNVNKSYYMFVEIIDCNSVDLEQLSVRVRTRDGLTTQFTSYGMRKWASPEAIVSDFSGGGILQSPIATTNASTDGMIVDIFWNMTSGTLKIGRVAVIEFD